MAAKQWYESQERFNRIDGAKFGGCLHHLQDAVNYVEWRIRKADDRMCVIQYYRDGKGYDIYVIEE